mgnify:CR=1 FL=1
MLQELACLYVGQAIKTQILQNMQGFALTVNCARNIDVVWLSLIAITRHHGYDWQWYASAGVLTYEEGCRTGDITVTSQAS